MSSRNVILNNSLHEVAEQEVVNYWKGCATNFVFVTKFVKYNLFALVMVYMTLCTMWRLNVGLF